MHLSCKNAENKKSEEAKKLGCYTSLLIWWHKRLNYIQMLICKPTIPLNRVVWSPCDDSWFHQYQPDIQCSWLLAFCASLTRASSSPASHGGGSTCLCGSPCSSAPGTAFLPPAWSTSSVWCCSCAQATWWLVYNRCTLPLSSSSRTVENKLINRHQMRRRWSW